MEKERRMRTISLVALIVAVLGLTVAFAALSRTLTINGTAGVDPASWDIHFENVKLGNKTGGATEKSAPTISADGTKIEGINVSLTKPGDRILYTFDIVNDGTIDAKMNGLLLSGINIDGDVTEDEMMEVYKMFAPKCDWDGDGITTDEERENCMENIQLYITGSGNTDELLDFKAKDRITDAYIELYFSDGADSLPKGDVEFNLDFGYNFVQK